MDVPSTDQQQAVAEFRKLLDRAGRTTDPVRRIKLWGEALNAVPGLQRALRQIRQDEVAQVKHDRDWSLRDLAGALGLDRTRVAHILGGQTRTGNAHRHRPATGEAGENSA